MFLPNKLAPYVAIFQIGLSIVDWKIAYFVNRVLTPQGQTWWSNNRKQSTILIINVDMRNKHMCILHISLWLTRQMLLSNSIDYALTDKWFFKLKKTPWEYKMILQWWTTHWIRWQLHRLIIKRLSDIILRTS